MIFWSGLVRFTQVWSGLVGFGFHDYASTIPPARGLRNPRLLPVNPSAILETLQFFKFWVSGCPSEGVRGVRFTRPEIRKPKVEIRDNLNLQGSHDSSTVWIRFGSEACGTRTSREPA